MRKILAVAIYCLPLLAEVKDRTFYERKIGHFGICFGITWGATKLDSPKLGIGLAMGLGLAKELYDVRHGQNQMCLRRDLCIDASGALAGYWVAKKRTIDKPLPQSPFVAFEIKEH